MLDSNILNPTVKNKDLADHVKKWGNRMDFAHFAGLANNLSEKETFWMDSRLRGNDEVVAQE